MSRTSYHSIAVALSESRPIALSKIGRAQREQWDHTVLAIADQMASENTKFARELFLYACGFYR